MSNEIVVSQQTEVQTMTSLQIAELTGKSHSHVIRDIKKMLAALQKEEPNLDLIDFKGVYEEKDGKGFTVLFRLNEQYTVCLVTGYDVPARLKVIKKVDELKAKLVDLPPAIDNTQLVAVMRAQVDLHTVAQSQLTESLAQNSRLIALLEAKQAPALPPSKPAHAPVIDHITCAHWLNRNKIKADWRLKDALCSNVAAFYVSHGKPFERTENGYGRFSPGQIERQYHLLVSAKQAKLSF